MSLQSRSCQGGSKTGGKEAEKAVQCAVKGGEGREWEEHKGKGREGRCRWEERGEEVWRKAEWCGAEHMRLGAVTLRVCKFRKTW